MTAPLDGQTALVTGAASGIGCALSHELATRGATVVVTDLDEQRCDRVAQDIRRAGGRAEAQPLDVTDAEAFQQVADAVVDDHGRIDFLFNNAGIGLAGQVRDMTVADWRSVVEVNLWGVIHGVSAAYPAMVEQGTGHIVNIASGAGILPRPGMAAYAATKHAVVGLSTSLRVEAEPLGVRVSVVCPGYIGTDIQKHTRYINIDPRQLLAAIPSAVKPMPPLACAKRILKGVRKNRAIIPVHSLAYLEWWIYRLSPHLALRLTRMRVRQFEASRRTAEQDQRRG